MGAVAPPTALLPARYERMAECFEGTKGFFASTPAEITAAMEAALAHRSGPSLINVRIDPYATRKPQEHDWLTRDAAKL